MKLSKYLGLSLVLSTSILMSGCKDKKIEEPVIATEETTEREEKNTIAVVGQVNLRENKETKEDIEGSSELETSAVDESEAEPVLIDLRGNETTTEQEIKETVNESEQETKEITLKETESSPEKIVGNQYQNFSVDMTNLNQYKYVGYDGDSTVFLDIDDNNDTTSMLVFLYRDNSYIADKFGGLDDLNEDQKHEIGIELVKELTGVNVDIATADFRDRESESGAKYIGFRFGDSERNTSGYIAFRLKKNKLECVINTIDSTDPEGAKKVKDDVIEVIRTVNFNGEECESEYDIVFTNINDGIQKMKNGE